MGCYIKRANRNGVLSTPQRIKTLMSNLTQNSQSAKTSPAYLNGYFDGSIGLPPATNELGSAYFSGYLVAVVKTGKTPF